MTPHTWSSLIRGILTDQLGPVGGEIALWTLPLVLALLASLPFLIVATFFRVRHADASSRAALEQVERLSRQLQEATSMLKDASALVRERLQAVQPAVNFGPDSPPGTPEASGQTADAPGGGQGAYNYCPSCKSIQYIKFLRCQACGFHVVPGK